MVVGLCCFSGQGFLLRVIHNTLFMWALGNIVQWCNFSVLGFLSSALDAHQNIVQILHVAKEGIYQTGGLPWQIKSFFLQDINLMKLIMTHMHCASHLLDIQALVGLLVMIHIEGVEIVLMITTSDLEEAVTKIHFASNAGVPSILESVLTHLLPLNPWVLHFKFWYL